MNTSSSSKRQDYKKFYGLFWEQMPDLVNQKRVPINTSQLMHIRLEFRNDSKRLKLFNGEDNNGFNTGDALIYHPNGDIKIVLDSVHLREINKETQIEFGSLSLSEEVYKNLEGEVLKKGKVGNYFYMNKQLVKSNPVWKILSRDQYLLNDYVDYIFAENKGENIDHIMSVEIMSRKVEFPEMRGWVVDGINDGSSVCGKMDIYRSYFIGINPETKFYNIRNYSLTDVYDARKQLEKISEMINPKKIDKIKNLFSTL